MPLPGPESSSCRLLPRFVRLVVLAAGLLTAGTVSAQEVSDEYRLKAAFLFRFPEFVEWPPEAAEGHATLDLCVAGPSPFGTVLQELAEGEAIKGRPMNVRRVGLDDIDRCDVLYLPSTFASRGAALQRVSQRPVLTVSDASEFLDEGGIMQLRLLDHRIRFEVSVTAAERAGLRVSPQLLRLALRVRGAR